jgi:hypothetical protein
LISGVGPVDENAPADPCCGGAVFDYDRGVTLDLPPGRYWITNRIRSSTTRTFDPQLSVAVSYPGLIGEVLSNYLMPVPVAAADAGDKTTACGSVQALINLASAQARRKLTQAQADEIIAQANHLQTVLGC